MPRIALATGPLVVLALVAACASPRGAGLPPSTSGGARPDDDSKAAWLRTHALELRTIEPGDDDFSDLEPLRGTLSGVRVLVLGEASHGDGTTFLAKARLVRFLHERLGYDVLAFESGFYDCPKAWQHVEAGQDAATAFRQSVFRIWTASRQVQPLIDYFAAAARSPHPLELTGFDPQFTGETSKLFADDLGRVAAAAGMPAAQIERVAAPLDNYVNSHYEDGVVPEPAGRAELLATLGELEARLQQGHGPAAERGYWIRLLAGLRELAAASWATDFTKSLWADSVNFPVRDRVMGEHLAWLARERYPHRKIIVWMHSAHAARGLAGVETSDPDLVRLYRVWQPAGAVAHRLLGDEVYTVAVLAYQGQTGFAFRKGAADEIPPAPVGSLEELFHRSGHTHAFLDLRSFRRQPRWLREPLPARALGYTRMTRARWHEVYDGVLYFDRMEASERAARPAAATGN